MRFRLNVILLISKPFVFLLIFSAKPLFWWTRLISDRMIDWEFSNACGKSKWLVEMSMFNFLKLGIFSTQRETSSDTQTESKKKIRNFFGESAYFCLIGFRTCVNALFFEKQSCGNLLFWFAIHCGLSEQFGLQTFSTRLNRLISNWQADWTAARGWLPVRSDIEAESSIKSFQRQPKMSKDELSFVGIKFCQEW